MGKAAQPHKDSTLIMKIPERYPLDEQESKVGYCVWSVARLHMLVKDFPVLEVPLDHLNVYNTYSKLTLREMVMHMKAALKSDLKYPIILDEDGDIMDGRHRIMKAIFLGLPTIKAVRFDKNPTPLQERE